jgi:hypothetical protein
MIFTFFRKLKNAFSVQPLFIAFPLWGNLEFFKSALNKELFQHPSFNKKNSQGLWGLGLNFEVVLILEFNVVDLTLHIIR